jgi:hypothetical protein
MSENLSTALGRIVQRRYDSLVARSANPSLAAIQNDLQMLDGVNMSEQEISEHLGGLDAGRRGETQKHEEAASASRRAAHASNHAETVNTPEAHFDAQMAHAAAAAAARSLAEYHDEQSSHHAGKAKEKADGGVGEASPMQTRRAPNPLCCARSLPSLLSDVTVPDMLLYMPQGLHRITPSQGGKAVSVCVKIDELSAERMEDQRRQLVAGGGKPFFSVQHNTQIAAFWPTKFFWATRRDPTGKAVTGVWADGEWSQAGKDAVEGKNFRSFSPTFFVDKISNDEDSPAEVECNEGAPLNMGALENDPAFGSKMAPLWSDNQPRA